MDTNIVNKQCGISDTSRVLTESKSEQSMSNLSNNIKMDTSLVTDNLENKSQFYEMDATIKQMNVKRQTNYNANFSEPTIKLTRTRENDDEFIPCKRTFKPQPAKLNVSSLSNDANIQTKNRFQVLTTATSMDLTCTISEAKTSLETATSSANINPKMSTIASIDTSSSQQRRKKPPPIVLLTKINYFEFRKHIKQLIKDDITAQYCPQGMKIYASSENDYNTIGNYFKSKGFEFYTFPYGQAKVHKVVMKGLPIETDISSIQQELTSQKFAVESVKQMRRKKLDEATNKIFLETIPVWIISAYVTPDAPDIHQLTGLFNLKVTLEDYKNKQGPLQCYKCQGFGHKAIACFVKPKCVKCGNEHLTQDCTVDYTAKPKCANCQLEHTANYKECPKFIKYVNGIRNNREQNKDSVNVLSAHEFPNLPRREGLCLSDRIQQNSQSENSSIMQDLKELWDFLKSFKVYFVKFKMIMARVKQENNLMSRIDALFEGLSDLLENGNGNTY